MTIFALGIVTVLSNGLLSATPTTLTVDEAVQRALSTHPAVNAARYRAEGSDDTASSVRGRLLPAVHLSDELSYYDSPFEINFGTASLTAREQTTNTFAASASQPILGLWGRLERYRAASMNAAASAGDLATVEAAMREAVRVEYLRHFEARAIESVAQASRQELAEQVSTVTAKVSAGVLTNSDLLRVEVAEAAAEQEAIVARARAQVSRARILSAIGLSPGNTEISLEEPSALLASAMEPAPSFEDARSTALSSRSDLHALASSKAAADHESTASLLALLPEVDAEATYLHVDGQVFLPKNQGYVGIMARWPVFEWGASWYAHKASEARADGAAEAVDQAKRRVEVEIAERLAGLSAAQSALGVADKAIKSAEEAYRVTKAQVDAGAATTTDLLDAEAALTQARSTQTKSHYEAAIARAQLDRVLGE